MKQITFLFPCCSFSTTDLTRPDPTLVTLHGVFLDYRKVQKNQMAGQVTAHGLPGCCAHAKKKRNALRNGKDAPPFRARTLVVRRPGTQAPWRPCHHNKQKQRVVNNHPSWDRSRSGLHCSRKIKQKIFR